MTSIIQFADIHFGVEDKAAMAAVKDTVDGLKPDVTLICGDITQNGKKEEFYAARDWIRTLSGPKVITPGNHDTPMFGIFQRLFDPFGRYNRIIAPLSEPHYTDQNVCIMPINTSRGVQAKADWSLGVVDIEELEKCVKVMQATAPQTVKLFIAHHPFIYPPSSPLQKKTEFGPKALKRLSELNIDGVLTGHVHTPFMLDRQPDETEILSIGAGTLSVRRRDKPASFNHMKIDGEMILVTEIFWDNDKFETGRIFTKKIAELKSRRSVV